MPLIFAKLKSNEILVISGIFLYLHFDKTQLKLFITILRFFGNFLNFGNDQNKSINLKNTIVQFVSALKCLQFSHTGRVKILIPFYF
jgi:hypothetical protein